MSSLLAMVLVVGMLPGVPTSEDRAAQAQAIPPSTRWVADDGSVWEFGKLGKLQTTDADGETDFPSRYVLNTTANPPHIDVITIDGTMLGIYRLKGKRLEFCFACPGDERPTMFTPGNDEDRSLYLLTLRRVKLLK